MENCPNTIDKDLIIKALGLEREDTEDDRDSREFMFKTATTLRLEFVKILKIENLQNLTSLTRLFLDNNLIERISGLDRLIHLTWLDLSFNRIIQIEGLEALKKLEVLALYNNEISKLEHLEHLSELKVLRVGHNKIQQKDSVVYLRKLISLKTLSIKENPFCDGEDWETFCMALLPNLAYLETMFVTHEKREAAMSKHQGDIFRAHNQEEEEREIRERKKEMMESERKNKAAFVASLRGSELLKALLKRNEEEENLLRDCLESCYGAEGTKAVWEQFKEEMTQIGDEIYSLGLKELTHRENEVKVFEDCVKGAQKCSQNKGVKVIDAFMNDKDVIFDTLYEMAGQFEDKEAEEITELQREEVEKLQEQFGQKIKETWSVIMSHEMNLVNQTEQVLGKFERNLSHLMDGFVDSVKDLFARARGADTRYFRKLSELGEEIEELPYLGSNALLADQEVKVSSVVARCHDGHQELLLEEEEKLRTDLEKWKDQFLHRFRRKERKRNRNRILELNHFVDVMRQEAEELDILPQLQIGEDILID